MFGVSSHSATLIEVETSIKDHNFHLDSPVQPVMERAGVLKCFVHSVYSVGDDRYTVNSQQPTESASSHQDHGEPEEDMISPCSFPVFYPTPHHCVPLV